MGILASGWLAGIWLLARLPGLRPPEEGPASTVSVVIPVRDEARAVGDLLASLSRQTLAPLEIVVVDDHSTDATAIVARHAGARVLTAADLPSGWTGKTWACHQGVAAARGELLLLLDADVTLAPDAVARLVAEHRRHTGLVSVGPWHRIERPYERLSAVANAVALMGTGAFTPRSGRRPALAFGPCMIMRRDRYLVAGGHAHPDVRGRMTEDLALARRFRAIGDPVAVLAGRGTVEMRMYPDGLGQLVEGWTRTLAEGAAGSDPRTAAGVVLWVTAALVACATPVRVAAEAAGPGPGGGGRGSRPGDRHRNQPGGAGRVSATAALAWYGAFSLQIWWMLRRIGRFGAGTSLLFPLPLSTFVAVFVRSSIVTLLGRPRRWRGRVSPRRS